MYPDLGSSVYHCLDVTAGTFGRLCRIDLERDRFSAGLSEVEAMAVGRHRDIGERKRHFAL